MEWSENNFSFTISKNILLIIVALFLEAFLWNGDYYYYYGVLYEAMVWSSQPICFFSTSPLDINHRQNFRQSNQNGYYLKIGCV